MFTLLTLRHPNGVYDVAVAGELLVVARHLAVEFYSLAVDPQPQLDLVRSVEVTGPVRALVAYSPDCVVAWADGPIFIRNKPTRNKKNTVWTAETFARLGSSVLPIMVPFPESNCLAVHCSRHFLDLIPCSGHQPAKLGARVDLGLVSVVAMTRAGPAQLAVLVRDFNSLFALRFYTLLSSGDSVEFDREMGPFASAPTVLVPRHGGVMAVSSSRMFYFPADAHRQLSVDPAAGEDVVVSHQAATSSIQLDPKASFVTAAAIDDDRTILIADNGDTFLVHLSFNSSITAFRAVALGRSLAPSAAAYLSGGLFFVGSAMSRSVLAQLRPESPHISIVQYMSSTPPVLDLAWAERGLVVCQGGYFSGELVRFSPEAATLAHQSSVRSRHITKLAAKNTTTICTDGSDNFYINGVESEEGPSFNLNNFQSKEHSSYCDDYVAYLDNNEVYYHTPYNKVPTFVASVGHELSRLVVLPGYVLVVSCYDSWLFVEKDGKFHDIKLSVPAIDADMVLLDYLYVFLYSDNEIVVETRKPSGELVPNKTYVLPVPNTLRFARSKSPDRYLFSQFEVYRLVFDEKLGVFHSHVLLLFEQTIKDLVVADKIAISFDEKLTFFALDENESHLLIHSLKLFMKVVPLDPVLCAAVAVDVANEKSYLQIIDIETMLILDEKEVYKLVDIVVYDKGRLLALTNTAEIVKMFEFYGELRPVDISTTSILPSSFNVANITPFHKSHQFYVSGDINFAFEVNRDGNKFFWTMLGHTLFQLPTFTICARATKNELILSDVIYKIYHGNTNMPVPTPILSGHKANITAFDVFHKEGLHIVYGDDVGNIFIARLDGGQIEQKYVNNVGDQVNVIKTNPNITSVWPHDEFSAIAVVGTSNGGLYKVGFFQNDELEQAILQSSGEGSVWRSWTQTEETVQDQLEQADAELMVDLTKVSTTKWKKDHKEALRKLRCSSQYGIEWRT